MNILFIKATNSSWRNPQIVHPLGLMQLSSYLKKHRPGCNIRLIDTRITKLTRPELVKAIANFSPDVVGISGITNESTALHEIAADARKTAPSARIIAGGPYPTAYTQRAVADPNIDFAVIGEGEETLAELLDAFSAGSRVENINGIAFRKDGQVFLTPPRALIEDIDCLPFPDWEAVDIKAYPGHYRMSIMNNDNWMPLFTSRGCPYQCIYCHNILGKRFRPRSAEKVIEEIDILYNKYGIKEFDVIDDIFNFDTARTERICDLIAQRGYDLSLGFPHGLRLDRLDERLLSKLEKAGTKVISFPVESVTPRIQELTGKGLKTDNLEKLVDCAVELGIFCTGLFMIGFPTETKEEMQNTVDFAVNAKFHSAEFFTVTAFQGTKLWEMLPPERRNTKADYSEYNYLRRDVDQKLLWMQRKAYIRFYFNPLRIIRILAAYRKISPLYRLFFRFSNVLKRVF